jgi:histidine triad (HIT) family protein
VSKDGMMNKHDCIFCRIVRGEIGSRKVYDADLQHQAVLGRMLGMAGELARSQGLSDGFRTVINTGRVGRQEVYHLHIHVFGGAEPLGSGGRNNRPTQA